MTQPTAKQFDNALEAAVTAYCEMTGDDLIATLEKMKEEGPVRNSVTMLMFAAL